MLGLSKKIMDRRNRRRRRIRTSVRGTSGRPRLVVFRSNKHIYAQIIDDTTGMTMATASSCSKEIAQVEIEGGGKIGVAKLVGAEIARRAKERDIAEVVFDRNLYVYHGRVKALAEAAREHGLRF
ncbi:50S ribosomal protein L18 [bacterium]|nr:50S ribosomal protein L18 [candidate division CSSED10-310 bacterium]